MNQETFFIKNRHGYNMSVRITKPESFNKLAFLEHGFSGCKDENHMVILEEELSKKGYMVVNLDAIDSLNASESSPKGPTFTGHYSDLEDLIEWARGQDWFIEPFTLAGHSMGAASVLFYAENYPKRVDFLLPISFPWLSGYSKNTQDNPEELADWKTKGYWDKVSESRGRTLRVPYNFIENLMQYDFLAKADKVTAKTVLIIGDQEKELRLDNNRKLLDVLKCEKELIILPNTHHVVAKTPENAKTFRETLQKVL